MLLDINDSPQILAKSPHIMVLVLISLWFYIPQTTVQRYAEYPRKKFYPTHSLAKFRGESAWQYPPPGAFVPRFLSPPPSPPQQQWRPHHGRSTGGPPPGSAPWRKNGCRLVAGADENHLGFGVRLLDAVRSMLPSGEAEVKITWEFDMGPEILDGLHICPRHVGSNHPISGGVPYTGLSKKIFFRTESWN